MTELMYICEDCKVQFWEYPEDGQCDECYGFAIKSMVDDG